MNRKEIIMELKKNPRIELLPSLLIFPILTAFLVTIIVVPNLNDIINAEAFNIFGIGNFVDILIWIFSLAFILILCIIILTLFWRKKTPAFLHIIPGMLFLMIEILLIYTINHNNFLTINYIYQILGNSIALGAYITLASVLLIIIILLLYGIPKLWNTEQDSEFRFRPKTLAIVTLVSSIFAILFLTIFLIGHHSMIFWQVIMYKFEWNSPPTVVLEFCILAFFFATIFQKNKNYLITRFKLVESKFTKVLLYLKPLLLIGQAFLIILIGVSNGFPITLLNPLAIITYAESVYYLCYDIIFPRFKKLPSSSSFEKKIYHIKKFIVVCPLMWIVLFQPLLSLPPEPNLPVVELNVVRNSYATLSNAQKTLFDTWLDEAVPANATPGNYLPPGSERGLTRVASALLFRNGEGDVEHASYILNYVMNGTNQVAFIGMDLILIMERHQSKLDPALITRINERLILIAEDAYNTNERPTWTNMALMGAFVMEWVGIHLNRPEIRDSGIRKSWSLFLLFQRNNTFSEFNSPTYGGVDMNAIVMWRELGPTETMRRMGAIMEQSFWEEIGAFYHAGFKNVVGPYFRKYGMDMCSYTAILGLWIALVIDDLDKAPLPNIKDGEIDMISSAVQLGHSIPSPNIVKEFNGFTGSRYLKRNVPSDISNIGKGYSVTTMLTPKWMMGGAFGRIYTGGQFATGTLMWNSTDDSHAWLLVSGKDALDVIVSENSMQISQTCVSTRIVFYIKCNTLTTDMINGNTWNLPGIILKTDIDPSKITVDVMDGTQFKGDYEIRENLPDIVRVTCLTDQITLQLN